jgi:hypothetical protein
MAAELRASGAEGNIDYFIIGYVGAPVDAYYRVFVWEPPLDMGDQHDYPDSIVLCGKGGWSQSQPWNGYPYPIERTDTTWAVNEMHLRGFQGLWHQREIRFWSRIVLLPDTSIDTIPSPSDTVAVVVVHLWAVDYGSYKGEAPNRAAPPSISDTFVLVVSSRFRDWVVSTTNPQWKWDYYIQPLLEILKQELPGVKRVVWLGEQNAGVHGGTPEPGGYPWNGVQRWDKYYDWITTHGLPGYPGRCYAWCDSMRSHKMQYYGIDAPTGLLDYASDLLITPGRTDLVDGISFNLYICHWAPAGYEGEVDDDLLNPYERIPSDMEQIAAFNDSLGGKGVMIREIITPTYWKRWEDKFALDTPNLFGYKLSVSAQKEGGF